MLPILNVGPLAIQTPGLILILGLWIGLTQAEKYARRLKINPDLIYTMTFLSLAVSIVGARLTYVAQNPAAFQSNWIGVFSFTPQMLDWSGGALLGVLAALIYGQRKKMPFWLTVDALTPGIAIITIAYGFALLASGDAFGAAALLPWSIYLWDEWRHPTQIYAILAAIAITTLIWPRSQSDLAKPGLRFLLFIIFSALASLFIEAFRGDSMILLASIRTNQILAWFTLAIALYLVNHRMKESLNPEVNPTQ